MLHRGEAIKQLIELCFPWICSIGQAQFETMALEPEDYGP